MGGRATVQAPGPAEPDWVMVPATDSVLELAQVMAATVKATDSAQAMAPELDLTAALASVLVRELASAMELKSVRVRRPASPRSSARRSTHVRPVRRRHSRRPRIRLSRSCRRSTRLRSSANRCRWTMSRRNQGVFEG
jgi:hypothetical protein